MCTQLSKYLIMTIIHKYYYYAPIIIKAILTRFYTTIHNLKSLNVEINLERRNMLKWKTVQEKHRSVLNVLKLFCKCNN